MLAMQAAGSSDSGALKDKVFDVANAPGEEIYPGQLAKALQILKDGGEIDYVGASAVELIGGGESAGQLPRSRGQGQHVRNRSLSLKRNDKQRKRPGWFPGRLQFMNIGQSPCQTELQL